MNITGKEIFHEGKLVLFAIACAVVLAFGVKYAIQCYNEFGQAIMLTH